MTDTPMRERIVEAMDQYPKVILCAGGWFVVKKKGDLGSGPWDTVEQAQKQLQRTLKKDTP